MNRRGSALAVVLFLLALLLGLSALVAGQARLRWLAGTRALSGARLDLMVDERLGRTVPEWDPQFASRLPIDSPVALPTAVAPTPGIVPGDSLRRLGALLFERRVSLSQQSVDGTTLLGHVARQELLQLISPALPDSGAVHAGSGLILESGALVDGHDVVPAGWGSYCPTPAGSVAGVHLGPGSALSGSCASTSCLTGAPPQALDSLPLSIWSAPAGWLALAPDADRQLAGVVVGPAPATLASGACDQTQPLNWGDPISPASACGDYFPLILAQPGAVLMDGEGQGVILALGSVTLSGSVRFAGVILAQGSVELRDAAQVTGVVIARDTVQVRDGAVVQWSRCAFDRARNGAAQPARVAGWSSSRLP